MTSMLSFAWRQSDKQQQQQQQRQQQRSSASAFASHGGKEDQSQWTSSPVPDVTASASGETHLSSSHGLDQHDEESTMTTAITATTRRFDHRAMPTTPMTPEGLRPRKSINQICQELGLPAHVLLDRVHWLPPSFPMTTTLATNMIATTTDATRRSQQSTGNVLSNAPSSVQSPQVSNSSFYSRSSSSQNRIAESPNLQIGHAKTAVGALIAMGQSDRKPQHDHSHHQQQQVSVLPSWQSSMPPMMASMPPHATQDLFSGMDVLPPRGWIDDEEEKVQIGRDDDEDSTSIDFDLPYQELHETTPVRRQRSATVLHQSPESTSTMTTVTSSNHASPSSNYNWRRSTRDRDNRGGVNVSFSSQIGLIAERQGTTTTKPGSYNFDSILAEHDHVTGFVVESDHATHVSAMSQSTSAKDKDELAQPSYSQASQQQQPDEQNEHTDNFYYQFKMGGEDVMERALRKRKNSNNRQAKEKLLLAVVERLQDDHQLLADLREAANNNNKPADQMSDWLAPTGGEGLLTGLDPSKRNTVIRQLDSILKEMTVAQPEEFFMSPSQVQGYAHTHSNLHHALVFARTLVLGAVSEMEKENAGSAFACRYHGRRWKCRPGFRSALGIDEIPQSPESVRGGDTSVFSLPSDDNTPHTSNVSLTTTITSQTSPIRTRSGFTNIRPTLETVSTLLYKLSRACLDLTDSAQTIRATDQLKRVYLKLVALQTTEIRALMDAFELEYIPPHKITRQVSEDDEAVAGNERHVLVKTSHQSMRRFAPPSLRRSTILPPMPSMATLPLSSENVSFGLREPQMIPSKQSEINNNRHNDSLMSLPQTEDMTSLPSSSNNGEGVVWLVPPDGKDSDSDSHGASDEEDDDDEPDEPYDYVDDLRRQVGSTDYDDEDGGDQLREGPEGYDECFAAMGDDDERCAAVV